MQKLSVLFLQGPLGPFFRKLAKTFTRAGYKTHKINFNGGDRYYSGADEVTDYTGKPEHWPSFLHEYLLEHSISAVFLLGDCRFYHRTAKPICAQLGVAFMVFEEGYLRPNTVTLEQDGVNALSTLDTSVDRIRRTNAKDIKTPLVVGNTMRQRIVYASLYYWAAYFGRKNFADYMHHRAFHPAREGYCWLRGFVRKWLVKPADYKLKKLLTHTLSQKFYLVPLQVHDDSQKIYHSNFGSVESFISEAMASFKNYSKSGQVLCFKHHPMDRGYTHYGEFIKQHARRIGLEGRVLYCHDIPLPELYDHVAGVVTVNSTVGMSALLHGVPVKVMGRAMYDIEGLTHQGSLASFWQEPQSVDRDLFKRFHALLFKDTQLNGSFFKHLGISCDNALGFFEQLTQIAEQPSSSIHPFPTSTSATDVDSNNSPLYAA